MSSNTTLIILYSFYLKMVVLYHKLVSAVVKIGHGMNVIMASVFSLPPISAAG